MSQASFVSHPFALPGKCQRCGTSSHPKGFLDTGMQAEFYGAVYFCYACIGEFATLFGFLTVEERLTLETKLLAREAEVKTLASRIEMVHNALSGHLSDYPLPDVMLVAEAVDERNFTPEPRIESINEPISPVSDTEQLVSDEFSSKQEPDGVSESASDDDEFNSDDADEAIDLGDEFDRSIARITGGIEV